MDMSGILRVMGAWNTFKGNHPKFPAFIKAVSKRGLREDSVVEIVVTTPEGERIETSIKVQESDLEFLRTLSSAQG